MLSSSRHVGGQRISRWRAAAPSHHLRASLASESQKLSNATIAAIDSNASLGPYRRACSCAHRALATSRYSPRHQTSSASPAWRHRPRLLLRRQLRDSTQAAIARHAQNQTVGGNFGAFACEMLLKLPRPRCMATCRAGLLISEICKRREIFRRSKSSSHAHHHGVVIAHHDFILSHHRSGIR